METVKLVGHGVASRLQDRIFVNRVLLKSPRLFKRVLVHEFGHTVGEGVFQEFKHDFFSDNRGLCGFILYHPSTWTVFLPFNLLDNRWVFNTQMTLLHLLLFIVLMII